MMKLPRLHALLLVSCLAISASGCSKSDSRGSGRDGSKSKPLVVMLVPSETGSRSVMEDYAPLFDAITRTHDIYFDMKMGDSYNAVVEGMVVGHLDIAFFGPVTFDEAKRRGGAELLAVEETKGSSIYYSGIYHLKESGMKGLGDLKGKAVAVGDPKSTSSFRYPIAMLVAAKLDPPRDLSKIIMAGSHSASLEQLEAGHVDAAAASLNAFDKVVQAGAIDGQKMTLLAKSDPIPSPPLAMNTRLSAELKSKLRQAFHTVHQAEGVTAEMLLGYGGKKVDRYNAEFDPAIFDQAMGTLGAVTEELTSEIIDKAGQR